LAFWDVEADPEIPRFSSSGEIENAIAQIWNYLTFDDVQSVSRDWIRRLASVAENDEEHISE
jgi:hypothetical protein